MLRNRFQSCLLFFLISFWLLAGCKAPEDKQPDNLIDEDRMADILTEVHIAEARVSRMSLHSIDSSNIVYKRLEGQIFKKFGVDTATYRKSYIYYSSHPAEMESVYKKITDKLTEKTKQKRSTKP